MTKKIELKVLADNFEHLKALAKLQRPSAYAPLYHEPTPNSGERICIGVAAKCGDEIAVYIMDELAVHQFLSGSGVDWLRILIQRAALELREFIDQKGFDKIADWPPAGRIEVGPTITCSLITLDSVINIGLMASSSFYRHAQEKANQRMLPEKYTGQYNCPYD